MLLAGAAVMALLGLLSPFGLTVGVVFGVAAWFASITAIRVIDRDRRLGMIELFSLAVLLRWVAACISYLIINQRSPGIIAPDEYYYDSASLYYAEFLAGHVPDPYPDQSVGPLMWVSSTAYYLFGFVPMVPRMLNGIVGGWTAVFAGLIGARLVGDAVGRRTALLAAVTPSLALWSALNTKDTATLLGAEMALYAFLALRERARALDIVTFVVGIFLVGTNRSYEVVFIGFGLAAGIAFGRRDRMARNIGISAVLVALLVLVLRFGGAGALPASDDSALEAITTLREAYANGAGSAVDLRLVDTSTPTGLALWAPIGLFYFYMAPIPFTGSSVIANATSPEMIAWYFLLPSMFRGAVLVMRNRFQSTMPLLTYVAVSSVGWAIVVTNVGTLYRYRSQVLFVLLIFIATDMVRRQREKAARAMTVPAAPPSIVNDLVPRPSVFPVLRGGR
jgi:hypothetical protein